MTFDLPEILYKKAFQSEFSDPNIFWRKIYNICEVKNDFEPICPCDPRILTDNRAFHLDLMSWHVTDNIPYFIFNNASSLTIDGFPSLLPVLNICKLSIYPIDGKLPYQLLEVSARFLNLSEVGFHVLLDGVDSSSFCKMRLPVDLLYYQCFSRVNDFHLTVDLLIVVREDYPTIQYTNVPKTNLYFFKS